MTVSLPQYIIDHDLCEGIVKNIQKALNIVDTNNFNNFNHVSDMCEQSSNYKNFDVNTMDNIECIIYQVFHLRFLILKNNFTIRIIP